MLQIEHGTFLVFSVYGSMGGERTKVYSKLAELCLNSIVLKLTVFERQ